VQHRANRNVRGRHRRTTALHSHRAPAQPLGEKSRYAVAVALVAGVGVAGVTAATEGAAPSAAGASAKTQAQAASQTQLSPAPSASVPPASVPSAVPSAAQLSAAGVGSMAAEQPADGSLSFAAQGRKVRPLPKWVNPLPEAAVTSCFGQRWGRLHAGVDLAAPNGTPIHAAGAGVVVAAGPAEGYGNAVLIDHGNGYLTHYGHMSAITAKLGQRVEAGDQIGNEGSTGHSTGPHLHFEVHQGSYQNPIEPTRWLHDHGVDIPGCVTFG